MEMYCRRHLAQCHEWRIAVSIALLVPFLLSFSHPCLSISAPCICTPHSSPCTPHSSPQQLKNNLESLKLDEIYSEHCRMENRYIRVL